MPELEPKKLALIRILQIFERYSAFDHPLRQEDIGRYLEEDYGIVIERKAIGRNISLLREAGYDIESTRSGSFLASRSFEDSELRMLIDGVLSSKYISPKYSRDLIERLCGLSNVYFKSHIKNIYSVNDWSKTDNAALFYNIDMIDLAIEKGVQIAFDYNKFGEDKRLHKSASHRASPYQLILHNQKYYLMALNERWHNMSFYRLDRISNMTLVEGRPLTDIRTIEGYENGIDYKKIATGLPYMFTDKPQSVEFIADKKIIDHIVDWFGKDIRASELDEEHIKVELTASVEAMEHWAKQYLGFVEITKPAFLREKIKEALIEAVKKYD